MKKVLRNLTLDPDKLPRPIEPPGDRDFVICGCPRTGTTLLTSVLFQPPTVVTVSEPWDGLRLPPAELFSSLRQEIATTGKLHRGRLNIDLLLERGDVRWSGKEFTQALEVESDYLLGVKWTAYWRYLDLLPDTKFLVCIRNPLDVISSFKKAGPRMAQGLDHDIPFNRKLNEELQAATNDPRLRRVLLYEYVNSRVVPHMRRPNVLVVRYERWFEDQEQLMEELSSFLDVELGSGPAVIRPPSEKWPLSSEEIDLIYEHCGSAKDLGYE